MLEEEYAVVCNDLLLLKSLPINPLSIEVGFDYRRHH